MVLTMMNTRLFSLHGKSFDEQQEFVNAMNAKAEEIVATGGVWQVNNSTRKVSVYPVTTKINYLGSKSVKVRALKGKPFMVRAMDGKSKIASAEAYFWAEDIEAVKETK